MASSASPRRGQRRRLLMAWSRSPATGVGRAASERRTAAEYGPAALPERQPAIATYLPTGLGGFAVCTGLVIVGVAAVLAVGLYEPLLAAFDRAAGPRFAKTIAALRTCVDPRSVLSVAGWLAQLLLLGGAVVALVVRFMRRHRRDDFKGRYRAWGWLAGLLVTASCATQVPMGRVVGLLLTEATGIAFGPAGLGWWLAVASTLLVAVSLWAVLPLHERLATTLWLTCGLVAWGVSAGAIWAGTTRPIHAGIAPAAWIAGCGLVAIAMLAAARSVIREVRGETGSSTKSGAARVSAGESQTQSDRALTASHGDEDEEESGASTGWDSHGARDTDYTDGSEFDEERETRHLSKAERKRLKKLARMSRAA